MSVLAKTFNKPFYVVAESFKFVRMFPISQDDLPNAEKVRVAVTTATRYSLLVL